MILLDLLCYVSVAIAGIIGVLKNSAMLRDRENTDKLLEEYNIHRLFRGFFIPTFYGWLFIECAILAMVLFFVRDTVSQKELESWQDKLVSIATTKPAEKENTTGSSSAARDTAAKPQDSIAVKLTAKPDSPAIRKMVLKTPQDSMTAEQKGGGFITIYGDDVTEAINVDDLKLQVLFMNDGLGIAEHITATVTGVYEFDRHSYVNMKVGKAEKATMLPADTTVAYCHFSKRKIKLPQLSLYCKITYTTKGKEIKRQVLLCYSKEQKWNFQGEKETILNHLKASGAL